MTLDRMNIDSINAPVRKNGITSIKNFIEILFLLSLICPSFTNTLWSSSLMHLTPFKSLGCISLALASVPQLNLLSRNELDGAKMPEFLQIPIKDMHLSKKKKKNIYNGTVEF